MERISIRVTRIDAEHSGPIVASFLQGPPPRSVPAAAAAAPPPPAPLALSYLAGAGEGRRAQHRRLRAEGASVVYSAQNFGAGALEGGAYRYAVGVLSRKRGALELYEADGGGAVFGLQADGTRGLVAILGEEGAAAAVAGGGVGGGDGAEARAQREALVAAFGSQKKKKMESARKANIVDVNAVAAAKEVSGSAAAASAASAAAAAAAAAAAGGEGGEGGGASGGGGDALAAARLRMLPPFNLDATLLTEAYPLEGLLTEEVMGLLRPLAKRVLKAAAKGEGEGEGEGAGEGAGAGAGEGAALAGLAPEAAALLPAAFHASRHCGGALARLLALLAAGGVERSEAVRRLQCLLYAAHLIALHHAGRSLRARERASGEGGGLTLHASVDDSQEVAALALARFYEARWKATKMPLAPSERGALGALSARVYFERSKETEKRALYCIAALAVRAEEGGRLHTGALAQDMRISPKLLEAALRELGCRVARDKGGAAAGGAAGGEDEAAGGAGVATLTLPLTFPLPSRGKRGR